MKLLRLGRSDESRLGANLDRLDVCIYPQFNSDTHLAVRLCIPSLALHNHNASLCNR